MMGVFDRIQTPVECPQCGRNYNHDIQTKELKDFEGFGMANIITKKRADYMKADPTKLPEKYVKNEEILEALFECKTQMCRTIQTLKDIKEYGTVTGFGLAQNIDFFIDGDYLSGEYVFRKIETYDAEEIQEMKEYLKTEYKDIYELGMKKYGLLPGIFMNWRYLQGEVEQNG